MFVLGSVKSIETDHTITCKPLPSRVTSKDIMLAFGAPNCYSPVTPEVPLGASALSRGGGVGRPGASYYAVRSRSTSLPAVSELVGASEETGGVFDPLGLATDEVRVR